VTFTYDEVGATAGELPAGYQHLRAARVVGQGRELFEECAETVLTWGVQRGAGLNVVPGDRVTEGAVNHVVLGYGPLRTVAPCQVVYVVREDDRRGFAYGTLPGHPECGEESVVVSIDEAGTVQFEVSAFSRPARWFARLGGPITRLVQRRVTWRYLEAVHPGA
jgi:uncharacterized protein (UPF0548 family)